MVSAAGKVWRIGIIQSMEPNKRGTFKVSGNKKLNNLKVPMIIFWHTRYAETQQSNGMIRDLFRKGKVALSKKTDRDLKSPRRGWLTNAAKSRPDIGQGAQSFQGVSLLAGMSPCGAENVLTSSCPVDRVWIPSSSGLWEGQTENPLCLQLLFEGDKNF